MRPIFQLILLAIWVTGLTACDYVERPPAEIEGWKPLYGTTAEQQNIFSDAPRTMQDPGRIYIKDQYIYVNDLGKGIHVIQNGDPANPTKIAFWNIPACSDMAIKGHVLYANNGTDLVALDISNPTQISLLKRLEGVFPVQNFPPMEGYFECYDPTKGVVTAWVKATLKNPECYR